MAPSTLERHRAVGVVGHDYCDSVDHANYKPTCPFTGTVKSVKFDISGDAVKNAEAQTRKGMSHQ